MSSGQTANSHLKTPCRNENDDDNNHTEINTETLSGESSLEPNTNPTEYTQRNPPQIPGSS